MITVENLNMIAELAIGGGLLILAGLFGLFELRRVRATGFTKAVVIALETHMKDAVYAGILISEMALKRGEAALSDPQLYAVACSWYSTLPSSINVLGKSIPIGEIKLVVSQDEWNQYVRRFLDEAVAKVKSQEAYLAQQAAVFAPLPLSAYVSSDQTVASAGVPPNAYLHIGPDSGQNPPPIPPTPATIPPGALPPKATP